MKTPSSASGKKDIDVALESLGFANMMEYAKAREGVTFNALGAELSAKLSGKTKFAPIKTGIKGELNIEVTSGLSGGEEIVTGLHLSAAIVERRKDRARAAATNGHIDRIDEIPRLPQRRTVGKRDEVGAHLAIKPHRRAVIGHARKIPNLEMETSE